MATYIKTLLEYSTGDTIYPKTKSDAVYRTDNVTVAETTLAAADTHIANTNNPHNVTATQLNVYTKTEIDNAGYLTSIPQASSNVLGGIKIGSGLTISSGGVVSVTGGGVADSVAWGHITGTLSDQTDLNNILSTIPTNVSDLPNDAGYITGITSSDVTSALGYTPYNSTNPNGYTSNIGTITSVKTTAGTHSAINVTSGSVSFNVPTKTSHLTNDSGFITTETDPVFSASAAASINASDITNWNNKTSNVGTITGVSINSTSIATSGVANITSIPLSIISDASDLKAIESISSNSGLLKKTAANTWSLDTSTYATESYVDTAIENLPEPMIFKGSLGTGGTITSLPTASSTNTGFTYKVITSGTYASQSAKVGDTFISDGSAWVLIPSGDEPSGTVTSITIKANSPISVDSTSAITTSGTRTISHSISGVSAGTYNNVTVNTYGHVTSGSNVSYLTSETDPIFSASAAAGITSSDIESWNTAAAGGGTITGVSVNGTSVATSGVANITSIPLSIVSDASDIKAIEAITGTSGLLKKTAANTWSLDTSSYITGITSSMVTTALGYTPYNSTNPNGYTTNTGTVTKVTAGTGLKIGTASSGGDITTSGTINHINSVTAQTTQAVYPIKIDAQGHISAYGSAVSIPTKTSDITNDSGYITSYTETDPIFSASAASGITSSDITNWNSKTSNTGTVTSVRVQATSPVQSSTSTAQTSTLNTTISLADGYGDTKNPYASKTKNYVLASPSTANGVPSFRALVDADIPTLTISKISDFPTNVSSFTNDAGYVTTDEKLKAESAPNNITYYPVFGTSTSDAETKFKDTNGFKYITKSTGESLLTLGNGASGTSNSRYGAIELYGTTTYSTILTSGALTAARTISLPDKSGTIALTDDIPDISNKADKSTTLAGYGITDANISNGTITLGSNTITPLTSFTETDPVFVASAAHGITSSDITNWNGKVSSTTTAKIFVQSATPTGMSAGDIWIDTTGL